MGCPYSNMLYVLPVVSMTGWQPSVIDIIDSFWGQTDVIRRAISMLRSETIVLLY